MDMAARSLSRTVTNASWEGGSGAWSSDRVSLAGLLIDHLQRGQEVTQKTSRVVIRFIQR